MNTRILLLINSTNKRLKMEPIYLKIMGNPYLLYLIIMSIIKA